MKTKSLFQNFVFYSAVVGLFTLCAPSIKKLVVERKWDGDSTWMVVAALGTTTATIWSRYLDADGLLHTPKGLPGRDKMLEDFTALEEIVGSSTPTEEKLTKEKFSWH